MSAERGDGIRIDELPNGWPILQSKRHFRFTLDAVLLAAFPILQQPARIAELGAGTGAVSLLLCARGEGCVTGIELDPFLAALCQQSVDLNGLSERVNIINADVREIKNSLPAGGFSLVVANPPYRQAGRGRLRQGALAGACHELAGDTADFIKAAAWLLKYRGHFCMVHLPGRLPELLAGCQREGLEPKRLRLVHPSADKEPALFLLEAVKGGRPGLRIQPPLFVRGGAGGYSDELLACYAAFAS